jgi:hypothetical protein
MQRHKENMMQNTLINIPKPRLLLIPEQLSSRENMVIMFRKLQSSINRGIGANDNIEDIK